MLPLVVVGKYTVEISWLVFAYQKYAGVVYFMIYVCKKSLIDKKKLLLTRKKSGVTKIDKIRGCALPPVKKIRQWQDSNVL